MYGLQGPTKENIPTFPFKDMHSSSTNKTNPMHLTRSITCSNNQARMLWSHNRARATHKPISSTNQRYAGIKKYDEKYF
jgi:hypothetical protein